MEPSLPYPKHDSDSAETIEWIEALGQVLEQSGTSRTRHLVHRVIEHAQNLQIGLPALVQTPYINTIPVAAEPEFPGDEALERRIRRLTRWNSVVQVIRANKLFVGIGGHLSTYASAASLYEVGFNHFFRGKDDGGAGDQLYVQGHATPGIYARAFLEGRVTSEQLDHFRRECVPGRGLSSYPHPRLMPDFWEFPTVSMGLAPINAIYQARFNRYLHNRGICDTSASRVWAFLGDGECDEPESLGALTLAAREELDNLVFVVNCNLQRLDGPVRGNGKIIQELEAVFHGAGWNVIKVIWGGAWDPLFERDHDHTLVRRLGEIVDGEYQRYSVESGAYTREHLCAGSERLKALFQDLSDDDIKRLRRGGHDYRKLYAAYKLATETRGKPTVILAKTVKGWTLGDQAEARNVTHQVKKMTEDELRAFRDRLQLPIPDEQLADPPYYHPGRDSEEVEYMLARRKALGGSVPRRVVRAVMPALPAPAVYQPLLAPGPTTVPYSTTMAFVRLLRELLRDKSVGKRVVPIISDEARTFGMEPFFKIAGIYAHSGQKYQPVDHDLMFGYHERKDGQILEEGITECGSLASFIAAGSSYATHGEVMIPFFIFYSMFGFQRVGDQIWLLGDQRGRGFLLGATAGRTTLNGEGLQHQDGHSLLLASTVPCCVSYDPAFSYEVATIIADGLRRMYGNNEDVFYYLTLYNENYDHPPMPAGVEEGILKGIYRLRAAGIESKRRVRLLGSGSLLPQVVAAAQMLENDYQVAAEVYSVTSYQQLRHDALTKERHALLHPGAAAETPYVTQILPKPGGPVIAVSDFMRQIPDMISRWVPAGLTPLGTDGYGLSDSREALRRFFEVDAAAVVVTALSVLCREGQVPAQVVKDAMRKLEVDPDQTDPRSR
ncbi:MAG: pyruvate dehydrogenase (acetyl-transferring), homodimeric type [Planctomycetota bacterium]